MHHRSLVALVLLFCAFTAFAQTPDAPPQPEAPPPPGPMNVPRTTAPITLDGDLSDAAWSQAAVIDRFYETSPGNNTPPKVKTVAYLMYDARYFYIGVRADDPEPQRIRAPFVDRDGVIGTDDNIAIFLDTRNDKRSAIEIRVNPRGIQADGIFNDAGPIEDFSPDFFYDTAAKIDATGWSAEFRIPFSTLRYDQRDPQTWNILVWRNYPREFRYAFQSAPVPRGANCYMCFMHPLTGLTDLPAAGHLVVAPYVTGEQVSAPRQGLGSPLENDDPAIDGGVDVKWNPNANSTVDLTLNPDFSQIEGDIAQITTNRRFAVFFAEKRPFFLEGFDLFNTPFTAAYTRTIHDPKWGARGTGKFGQTAYTFLVAEDRGGGVTLLPRPDRTLFSFQNNKAYSAIGRLRHEMEKMFIGAVFTDREVSEGGGHNRVLGPDFQWRPTDGDAITGQLLYSDTDDPSPDGGGESSGHAMHLAWSHRQQKYDWFATLRDVADGFRADLGFIPQAGYRELEGGGGLSFYPENSRLRFIRPSVVVYRQDDQDGNTLTEGVSLGVNGFGAKNTQFFFGYRPHEAIRVVGSEGPVELEQRYFQAFVSIDPSRRIPRISLDARFGDQISFGSRPFVGEGVFLSLSATARPHDRLDLQGLITRETLERDGDRQFTVTIERLRAQYSFSAKSLLRLIGQYVHEDFAGSEAGDFTGSVLYSYKINWQTVLFAGYGDNRVLLDNNLEPTGRSFFFKVSYAYQR